MKYIQHGIDIAEKVRYDLADEDAFFEAIEQVHIPENIEILNTRKTFCMNRNDCAPIVDESLLLIDSTHLSVSGAKLFGNQIRLLRF